MTHTTRLKVRSSDLAASSCAAARCRSPSSRCPDHTSAIPRFINISARTSLFVHRDVPTVTRLRQVAGHLHLPGDGSEVSDAARVRKPGDEQRHVEAVPALLGHRIGVALGQREMRRGLVERPLRQLIVGYDECEFRRGDD